MENENVINILKQLEYQFDNNNMEIEVIKRVEDGSDYNVYKIKTSKEILLLKQCSQEEIKNYEFLSKISNINVPKVYEVFSHNDKSYILEQFIEGDNLCSCTRDKLIKALDGLIRMQNLFWNKNDIEFGLNEEFNKKVINRGKYLNDAILEEAYSIFLNIYNSIPRTITHCDLLPFNVIVSSDKSYIIDWEEGGILPFPLSFVRLIAYGEDDKKFLFYMSHDDKEFAIKYYYDNLLKDKGISYEKWHYILDCFLLYEYCEWIMLKNKSDDNNLEYYHKYLPCAQALANNIINQKDKYYNMQ